MDVKGFAVITMNLGKRLGVALAALTWWSVACSVSEPAQGDLITTLDQQPTAGATLVREVATLVPESPVPTAGGTQVVETEAAAMATFAPHLAPTTSFDPAGLSTGGGRGFVVLDDPRMLPGTAADWLAADEFVLGVVQNGEAHAFPVSQMAYHHIANTTIGGEPYLVTY